jgi:hypothetical protein
VSYSAPNATAQAAPANIQRQTSQDAQTALGIAAGATRAARASVSLWITEIESGRQIAIGQGSFQGTDFDIGAALLGPQAAGMLSGYKERVEGRTIFAALLRAFNATLEDARTVMPDDAKRVASESTPPAATPQPQRSAPALTPDGKYETVAGVNIFTLGTSATSPNGVGWVSGAAGLTSGADFVIEGMFVAHDASPGDVSSVTSATVGNRSGS